MKTARWFLFLTLPALCASAPQNDYKLMEGNWNVAGGEKEGKEIPLNEIMNREVIVDGNRYVVKEAGKVIDQGTFKLDAAKTPKTIDVKPTFGPHAGKTLLGIYELQGDERKTCMAEPGKPRPKEFITKAGGDEVIIKYKREKGKKQPPMFRYAICNETFEGWDHERICACVASHGYEGLEIAPFTLAPLITDVTPERRRALRKQAESAGLRIIGLHWLLAKTEGLQITAADETIRARTSDYLVELARGCADLGGELMVFGSPGQRRIPAGATPAQALHWAADTFSRAMPAIAQCGVKVCMEPLSPPEADFINTAAEAMELIKLVNHPQFVLHLDVKAMATEEATAASLIGRHAPQLGHFHANDVNRRGPGFGDTDFVPILTALRQAKYSGWVSVEVFDYTPDPETIARESIRHLRDSDARAERLEKVVSQYLGSKPR